MPLFLFFILQFTIRNLLINYTVHPPVWGFQMPQSCAADPVSSQEGGSSCQQVTGGWHGLLGRSNPSAAHASHGKLTGSRNYPLKTHLKWKNILGIISKLFYRLAGVTNVLGGKKQTNFQGCRSARLYLQGATTHTGPFSRPYILSNSLRSLLLQSRKIS